jgi:hypothetical protein
LAFMRADVKHPGASLPLPAQWSAPPMAALHWQSVEQAVSCIAHALETHDQHASIPPVGVNWRMFAPQPPSVSSLGPLDDEPMNVPPDDPADPVSPPDDPPRDAPFEPA